ncbi:MAG: YifB family Mg chelatase-like AAA ATPase [Coriobacteriia bacterium]|nr:YifB family Mg chelatase-like AAA ATPase [Coriobacteriia bacterium]
MPRYENVGFVSTATIWGIEALPVTVEVSVGNGLPGFHIIGLPDLAVREATRRVRQAIKASGYQLKNALVVVNLAPSSLRKAGSGFDLPIALAYLIATKQLDQSLVDDYLCVGELSLDGTVRAVSGQLAYEKLAFQTKKGLLTGQSIGGVFIDHDDQAGGIAKKQACVSRLADMHEARFYPPNTIEASQTGYHLDFADIAGNDLAKRALQIAAAGGHGLMMVGPPGSGKSMMAKRLPSILPLLDMAKRRDSALIHSVAGLPYEHILAGERPFRSPHHGASQAGMIGGGSPIMPGEIALAHNGVLFLDELPEFGSSTLQLLRQPIEMGYITLARAAGSVVFPTDFMLIAAANPCPCGYLGDDLHNCSCTPAQISRYANRVGGPLIDRFNMIVDVNRSAAADVLATGQGTSSADLRIGVEKARGFAAWRQEREASKSAGLICPETAQPSNEAAILASCQLSTKSQSFLEMASDRYQLSGRGIISTLSVARTIADMEEKASVGQVHLMEAIEYRPRDKK